MSSNLVWTIHEDVKQKILFVERHRFHNVRENANVKAFGHSQLRTFLGQGEKYKSFQCGRARTNFLRFAVQITLLYLTVRENVGRDEVG